MARYEYWDTISGAVGKVFYGASWIGQTFTPSVTHHITSVKLNCYKRDSPNDSPGDITVSIRLTSAGFPTGDDLTSGTIVEADIPSYGVASYDWVEAALSAPYSLDADIKYAIILSAPDGDAQNYIASQMTLNTGEGYTDGNYVRSSDSGETWADSESGSFHYDLFFEEWGRRPSELAGVIEVVETRLHYLDAYGVERYMEGTVVV